jgi:hypothetical protein
MNHYTVKLALAALAISSMACGMLQEQQQARADATGTQVAAQIFGTQTANAPTITATATATDTATPTATNTATITPTATETPLPDASQVVLREGDAPEEFQRPPRNQIQQQEERLQENEDLPFGSYSALRSADTDESIIAYVIYLTEEDARSDFGEVIRDPEGVAQGFAISSDADYQDAVPIEGLDELGDSSNGIASTMRLEDGTILHFDVIVFRRGVIGVFLYDIYVRQSAVNLVEIATILDQRALEVTEE